MIEARGKLNRRGSRLNRYIHIHIHIYIYICCLYIIISCIYIYIIYDYYYYYVTWQSVAVVAGFFLLQSPVAVSVLKVVAQRLVDRPAPRIALVVLDRLHWIRDVRNVTVGSISWIGLRENLQETHGFLPSN